MFIAVERLLFLSVQGGDKVLIFALSGRELCLKGAGTLFALGENSIFEGGEASIFLVRILFILGARPLFDMGETFIFPG